MQWQIQMDFFTAKAFLVEQAVCTGCETIALEEAYGRVLGEDLVAEENVPAFARSPYDGYAFRAADTEDCDNRQLTKIHSAALHAEMLQNETLQNEKLHAVTLQVIDDIRAGQVSEKTVVKGTAIRLMTGAPLPKGADVICKFEDTVYTDSQVTLNRVYQSGENVVAVGEDIKKGSLLAVKGSLIDTGIVGTLASVGKTECKVFKRLKIGILSTGDEVIPVGEPLVPGKIRNSNRYTIGAALKRAGFDTVYIGHAPDDTEILQHLIEEGEEKCDVIISTGGVSVGDYDLVLEAILRAGYEIPVRGVKIKPGMACAYGIKSGRLMLALSGNPASSLTNLECVCLPALRKMAGMREFDHSLVKMELRSTLLKGAKGIRLVRGRLESEDGRLYFNAPSEQGNIVISSAIGANAYGILRDTKTPVPAGTVMEGFFVPWTNACCVPKSLQCHC